MVHETERLLTRKEVMEVLRMSSSTLYNAIKDGRVPPPIEITPRAPRWPASALQAMIDAAKREAGYVED